MNTENENWFKELFIDEAKCALDRHNGTGSCDHEEYLNVEEVAF